MVSKIWMIMLITVLLCVSVQTNTEAKPQEVGSAPVQYKYFVFTPQCYHSLVQEFNVTDFKCVKLVVSKALGYTLIVGASIVKVPQIIKILMKQSVYGISFTSVMAEGMTNWVTIVYSWYRGTPFSIYGENAFILVQNVLILALFVALGRNVPKGVAQPGPNVIKKYGILFLTFCTTVFLTQNPLNWPQVIIENIMFLQICLFSFARLSQIAHLYRQKSTGSLALVTCLLVFLGNVGRLFTVLVEISDDYMFAISIILASILNGTILIQFFIYRKGDKLESEGKKNK